MHITPTLIFSFIKCLSNSICFILSRTGDHQVSRYQFWAKTDADHRHISLQWLVFVGLGMVENTDQPTTQSVNRSRQFLKFDDLEKTREEGIKKEKLERKEQYLLKR